MTPESGGICVRLTQDLPLGYLDGGSWRISAPIFKTCEAPGTHEAGKWDMYRYFTFDGGVLSPGYIGMHDFQE